MLNTARRALSAAMPHVVGDWWHASAQNRRHHRSRRAKAEKGARAETRHPEHGDRSGSVHGAAYGAKKEPRFGKRGSSLGRYGRRAAGGEPARRVGWAHSIGGHGALPLPFGPRLRKLRHKARARVRAREHAFEKRARGAKARTQQAIVRAAARFVIALTRVPRALLALTRRTRRHLPSAESVHGEHHTPLGHRARQTNLTAKSTKRRGQQQLTFGFQEGGRVKRRVSTEPHEQDYSAHAAPEAVPHEAGYMSDDARWAAKQHHFDRAGARTIHGNIASNARHSQGKRDHRGM